MDCSQKSQVPSRQNLVFPRMVDNKKFRSEFPIEELRPLRHEDGSPQLFTYYFVVDSSGKVVPGKIDFEPDPNFGILKKYVESTFNKYDWIPAYDNKNRSEKIRCVVKLSIYDDAEKHVYKVSIRLIYLPGREKMDDLFNEKSLILKNRFR